MTGFSARVYRFVFAAAAVYNVTFGLWAALAPRAFFNLFRLDPPRYPAIWACLGMVVGLYGVGYAYAAWRLDRAIPFIAIGLAGKLLGPIGWAVAVRSHELPFRTFPLIVFDDLMWWLPFALFLLEGTAIVALLKRTAPYWCAGVHFIAAIAAVAFLRGGQAPWPVRITWVIWMIAAQTLLGFYAWWGGSAATGRGPQAAVVLAGFAIAAAGVFFDYAGESMFLMLRPTRVASLLTGGAANALYTLGGVTLTIGSGFLSPRLRWWAWLVWTAGGALTIATIADVRLAVVIASAALMILFVPWVVMMGVSSK